MVSVTPTKAAYISDTKGCVVYMQKFNEKSECLIASHKSFKDKPPLLRKRVYKKFLDL